MSELLTEVPSQPQYIMPERLSDEELMDTFHVYMQTAKTREDAAYRILLEREAFARKLLF